MIRYLIAIVLVGLAGCSTQSPVLYDGQPIAKGEAYVLIHPHYDGCDGRFNLELTRVDKDGTRHAAYYPWMTSGKLVILRLKPGFYYVSALQDANCPMRYTFDWCLSLFEAEAGKLTYPGDWSLRKVTTSASTEGTLGGGSASWTFQFQLTAEPNPKIDAHFRQQFPTVAKELMPIYTKVQIPECSPCSGQPGPATSKPKK